MTSWTDLSLYAPNTFALQTLIVGAAVVLLGVLVLLREKWSVEGILFWICTITIGVWLFSFSCMYSSKQEELALFWAKAAYLGVPFMPSAIYHFTTVVLRISQHYRRRIIAFWMTSAFFAFTIVTTDMLIAGLHHYPWGWYPKYEWLSLPYMAFFFSAMVLSLRHYWIESRRAPKGSLLYHRAKELFTAFAIAYFASVDFLPKFGVPVYPVGYLFIFCFLLLAANVIWQYRLVDITPAFAADKILETMNEPVIVCDLDQRVRIVNPAFERLFGFDPHEAHGKAFQDFVGEGGPTSDLMRGADVKEHECLFRTREGSQVSVSLSASVLKDSSGKPHGYVIVTRDITEHKRMERELKGFNETLEEGVKRRTKELALKINELEWLNMVMMGREERILELKEQLRGIERPSAPVKKERANGHSSSSNPDN